MSISKQRQSVCTYRLPSHQLKSPIILVLGLSLAGCCFDSDSTASSTTDINADRQTPRGLLSRSLLADTDGNIEPLLLWSATMENWVRTAPGFTDRLPPTGTEEACSSGGTKLALISEEDDDGNYHFATAYDQCKIEFGGVEVTYQGKSTLQGSYVEISDNQVKPIGSTVGEDFSVDIAGYGLLSAQGLSSWNESLLGVIDADSTISFDNHSVKTVINSLSRTESENCELAVVGDFYVESSQYGQVDVIINTRDNGLLIESNCEYSEYQAQQIYTEQDKIPSISTLLAPQSVGISSTLNFEIPDAGSVTYTHSSGNWLKYEHKPAAVIVSGGTTPDEEATTRVFSKNEFVLDAYQSSNVLLIR